MNLPSAIILVNDDIDGYTKSTLTSQLFVHELISAQEFDARIIADPNYVTTLHLNGWRILVTRNIYQDFINRNLADIVISVVRGLAIILENKYGPPGLSLPVDRLSIYRLINET